MPPYLAAGLAISLATPALGAGAPTKILFVGNSFTHGRYDPVRTYNGGFGPGHVHDLLCPAPASCTEPKTQVDPARTPPPGAMLRDRLEYLKAHPAARYNEPGPEGGIPGIFLQFTREAGLDCDVSILAVSSATLGGYTTGKYKAYAAQIESPKWNAIVLQDQSFEPLPGTITVNGRRVATRGHFARFQAGVDRIVRGVDRADKAAEVPDARVILYETQPLASYGYTSDNPAAPLFGKSTSAPGGVNAPYVGDAHPLAAMAHDLHDAYERVAGSSPGGNKVEVALAGDAWVSAINQGTAERNPYLAHEPAGEVDLWDSDPLDACCTTPIGYHPGTYGAYLSALVLFAKITGVNPETLHAEFSQANSNSAAAALGVSSSAAKVLTTAAFQTVQAGGPVR